MFRVSMYASGRVLVSGALEQSCVRGCRLGLWMCKALVKHGIHATILYIFYIQSFQRDTNQFQV